MGRKAVRWLPLSLYTFPIARAWLGVGIAAKATEAFTEFDSLLPARFQTGDPGRVWRVYQFRHTRTAAFITKENRLR